MSDEASPAGANDPVSDLLDVLDLTRVGHTEFSPDVTGDETDADVSERHLEVFSGRSQVTAHGRVFGGQVLAQCVIAAGRSVASAEGVKQRPIHSLHGYFIRPGDSTHPIRFAVENLRDGRSFSVRRVHAMQYGHTILSATLSFQAPAGGLDHQATMSSVPDPDRVRTTADELGDLDDPRARQWLHRPLDVRTVEGALYTIPGRQHVAHQNVWMKAIRRLPDDPLLHAAILAYSSDYSLLESILRRHGLVWSDPRLRPASLDHSMWFHRPGRIDEWVLYEQDSPSASGGRGLAMGKIFSIDGNLICSVAQEGMVRIKETD